VATEFELRRIWDLPTRLFHWALVVTVVVGWYLGEYRDFSTIDLHFYFGYTTGGLLVFRLLWGLVGPSHARLSALIPGPKHLFAYSRGLLRRQPSGVAGHNPIGALSVLMMLIALIVQVATGLIAEDDGLFAQGPLREYVSSSTSLTANAIHYWNSRLLLALVGLHVTAILFYLIWKHENLIKPMISGWKSVKRKQ